MAAEIASRESVNVLAACSGGIISAGALGHLADEGKLGDVSSLTLLVSALDNAQTGTDEAPAGKPIAAAAALHARSGRRVAIVGRSRGGHFARAVAARRPELVSYAVSLGADLQAMFHCSEVTLAAVEAARRTAQRTGRAARRPSASRAAAAARSPPGSRRHSRMTASRATAARVLAAPARSAQTLSGVSVRHP